ncbi:coiled-coil domain-containing protein 77 [Salmo trutta]|uniref:Coiled-coil domain containing 77 n=1 Tax=Salmo trutta TaxID=8032 RepID=A0A673Z710_SALTR|nr:coiled-coil domain-containing protein 77-like [Salmo trutta]
MMESPTRDHISDGPTGRTPGVEDSPLPPIAERLAHLCASRELLEFYRGKVAQFDGVHEDLLEKYRCTTEDQKLQWEVEVSELQKALREREQALRLYSENNILKIREQEDSKRIQHLLALVGPDIGGITYFHSDPSYKVTIAQKKLEPRILDHRKTTKSRTGCEKEGNQKSRSEEGVVNGGSPEQYRRDNQTLVLQVEVLPVQMEEQTGLSKEKVESLLEDRRIHVEEGQVQHQRDQDPITALTDKLEGTQNLTDESSRDFLQLKLETQAREKGWMVEKDRLLQELNTNQDRLREARDGHGREQPGFRGPSSMAQPDTQHVQREELRSLQGAYRLVEMYREQCVTLETDLAQIREEGDVGREIFKDRSDKIAKRLQMMTQRYEALKKKAAMEVEGFKTDIKHLRQKLNDMEKQLFKVTLNVGLDHPTRDASDQRSDQEGPGGAEGQDLRAGERPPLQLRYSPDCPTGDLGTIQ